MNTSYNVVSKSGEVMLGSSHESLDFVKAYCRVLNQCEKLKSLVIDEEPTSYHVVELIPDHPGWSVVIDTPDLKSMN